MFRLESPGDGEAVLHLSGTWRYGCAGTSYEAVADALKAVGPIQKVSVVTDAGIDYDQKLSGFLFKLKRQGDRDGFAVAVEDVPDAVKGLYHLAVAVPEREGARREPVRHDSLLVAAGGIALKTWDYTRDILQFIGETSMACAKIFNGKVKARPYDRWLLIQQCGSSALPIVTLISLLVGMILAFVGAAQLAMFNATIFIADAVGMGMAMEMGALMTAIIMAGRTGASYAANLGTMQVNEEVDALKTFGYSPIEYLVLPRILALLLMMPLLCLYSIFIGIAGGAIVTTAMFDITFGQYCTQTIEAVQLRYFVQGLIKSVAFGLVIGFTGCFYGIRCGRSASAVGQATTSAVVMCIVWIVVVDAVITLVYQATGF